MPHRSTSTQHPLDSAIATLAWLKREECSLQRISSLVSQHPAIFGVGASSVELAAQHLENYVGRMADAATVTERQRHAR